MEQSYKFLITLVLVSIISIGAVGCDGDNNGGDTESGILNGRVQNVVEASIDSNKIDKRNATFFSTVKRIVMSSYQAIAQQGGITVNVLQDGVVIDTTTTDANGDFTVTGAGIVVLQFVTPGGVTVELEIDIPVGTVTTLNLTINEQTESATVNALENGLRCEGGSVDINEDEVTIDGNGTDDCIRAEGDCDVNITADVVNLLNCERCIDAEGSSIVDVEADTIVCEGIDDAIRSEDTSEVNITGLDCSISGSLDQRDDSSINIGCESLGTDDGADDDADGDDDADDDGGDEADDGVDGDDDDDTTGDDDDDVVGDDDDDTTGDDDDDAVDGDGEPM